MFNSILVPTDLTERSFNALEIALKIASHEEARVTLLHIIEMIQDAEPEDFQEFYDKLGRRAHKLMDEVIGRYENPSAFIEKKVNVGRRVKDIVAYAHDHGVDLIVLTSHKIDLVDSSQGWGTISHKVGILSHCPVMLVK